MDETTSLWEGFAEAYNAVKRNPGGPTFEQYAGSQGLAMRWAELMRQKAKELEDDPDSADLAKPLWLQAQTWTLLSALTNCRHPEDDRGPTAQVLLRQNPYLCPRELTAAIQAHDEELDEWITIRQMLYETSPYAPNALELHPPASTTFSFSTNSSTGRYLASTQAEIRTKNAGPSTLNPFASVIFGTGGASSAGSGNDEGPSSLASSLDLDSDIRQHGVRGAGRLSSADKDARQDLLSKLFSLVRTGDLDSAGELCRNANESWRVASFEAAQAWMMGNSRNEDGMDVDVSAQASGSLSRPLWKSACTAIARNPIIPEYERALYGALSGDLQSVLPVCRTWHDHLWAHLNALIETRLMDTLDSLGGYWQDQFGLSVSQNSAALSPNDEDRSVRVTTLDQVFSQIAKTDRDAVSEEAQEPYEIAQRSIILDSFDDLIRDFASKLDDVMTEMEGGQADLLTAFFAHLVLYLRGIGHDVRGDQADSILQSYIHLLQNEREDRLIALYAVELTGSVVNANEEYAKFLRSMDKAATKDERKDALMRAEQQGLDIQLVAKLVTSDAVKTAKYRLQGALQSPIENHTSAAVLSRSDRDTVRALEWTTFTPQSYPDALVAANAFLRAFWCSKHFPAVTLLFETLPEGFPGHRMAEEDQSENEYIEFALHSELKTAVDALQRAERDWRAELEVMMPNALKSEMMSYTAANSRSVASAYAAITKLLRSGWAIFNCVGGSDDRNRAWNRLRAIFVPDLILRLHAVLLRSSPFNNEHLQKAVDLPSIVAATNGNGESPVARFIEKEVLRGYLQQLERAAMLVVQRGSTDPLLIES